MTEETEIPASFDEPKNRLALALSQSADASVTVARRTRVWVILAILAIGVFYLATIREGHGWGDDFAMYIHHAKNIAERVDYQQTGFISNPKNIIGPQSYPPIFPLLLSPVYKLWGLNLRAMKIEMIFIFLLSLLAIFLAFKDELAWPYLVALIVLIGLNPQFWQSKDQIISDLPFLLFIYLSIYLIHKAYRATRTGRSQIIYALLIVASICLAYGTRSVGLVLIPCLLGYDMVKNKRPSRFAIGIVILTVALICLQNLFLRSDAASYSGHFQTEEGLSTRVLIVLRHVQFLFQILSEFWANGYSKILRLALFAILSGLAFFGYFVRGRKQITCFEIFVPLYVAPLIILPIVLEWRYLAPLIPLYFFYAFRGIRTVSRWTVFRQWGMESIAFAGLTAVILISYAGQYIRVDFGPLNESITKSESRQLFEYIRRETGEKDIFVFRKPRAFALLTGRSAAVWHRSPDDHDLWSYFHQIHAGYLITGPKKLDPPDQLFFQGFIDRNQERLQETFSNSDFRVYRIKEMP